jgi:phosphohistidine phosphatase
LALMSTLLLLRHAKSSWDFDLDDHDRPLSGRGRRDAVAAGQEIAAHGFRPDLVLCSTSVRTRQTWDRAVTGGAEAGEVRYLDRIYDSWSDELLRLVRETPDEVKTLMLIGHGPSIPDLAKQLVRGEPASDGSLRMKVKYPTSGLTLLEVTQPWASLDRAHLLDFVVPRG